METDAAMEKPKTVFPQQLAKRLLAFRTVSTGPTAIHVLEGNLIRCDPECSCYLTEAIHFGNDFISSVASLR